MLREAPAAAAAAAGIYGRIMTAVKNLLCCVPNPRPSCARKLLPAAPQGPAALEGLSSSSRGFRPGLNPKIVWEEALVLPLLVPSGPVWDENGAGAGPRVPPRSWRWKTSGMASSPFSHPKNPPLLLLDPSPVALWGLQDNPSCFPKSTKSPGPAPTRSLFPSR